MKQSVTGTLKSDVSLILEDLYCSSRIFIILTFENCVFKNESSLIY